jgi:hypothetical protein
LKIEANFGGGAAFVGLASPDTVVVFPEAADVVVTGLFNF